MKVKSALDIAGFDLYLASCSALGELKMLQEEDKSTFGSHWFMIDYLETHLNYYWKVYKEERLKNENHK